MALDALAKAATASAHLRQPGMKEAINRLLEHQLNRPEQVAQREKLLAQTAEFRRTAVMLPPGYREQLNEIAGASAAMEQMRAALKKMLAESGLGERLTAQIHENIAQVVAPSWDSIAETAEALASSDKTELENVVSTVGDELRLAAEPPDGSDEAALSPISGPLAASLAAVAVSAILAMLLRWTDFQISQADQATLDLALDLLSGLPAWLANGSDDSASEPR